MSDIYKETRSELLTKIVKTLAIKSGEISEMVELYFDCQDFRIRNANRGTDRTAERASTVVR